MTKKHFEFAAEYIRTTDTLKERHILLMFCLGFFRLYGKNFNADRFADACEMWK